MTWYAVQMKPHYDKPSQYQALKESLVNSHGLSPDDIWISGDGIKKNLYLGYVFFQSKEEKQKIWENIAKEKQIDSEMGIMEIPDSQMQIMMSEAYPEKPKEDISILDVVEVDETIYHHMYGIVVDIRDNDVFELGIKMFSRNQFILLNQQQFHKVRSLFEIWKFPKKKN